MDTFVSLDSIGVNTGSKMLFFTGFKNVVFQR
jgi:hypothetical protein